VCTVKANLSLSFSCKGFPILILMPLAQRIPLLSLRMDSWSSAWSLAMNLWICFHPLLEKGSMKTVRIFTNLITWVILYPSVVFDAVED
ncbi:hypothetical protein STEG23_020960, partial [Scotinomys teguina]